MTRVKIAQFKDGLSKYLRQVRRGGEVIVMDRDTPVARVVPFEANKKKGDFDLPFTPETKPARELRKIKGIKPEIDFDIVQVLLEDRKDRF